MAHASNSSLIAAFDAIHILGVVCLSIVLLTASISRRIHRTPTWYLYIISWILFASANLLILGRQTDATPERGLCLFQASMIYSVPVLVAVSTLVFLLEILLDIKHALRFQVVSLTVVTLLLTIPWMFFFLIFFLALGMGITHPNSLERHPSGMFCHFSEGIMSHITAFFVLLFIQLMLIVGALITTTIRRQGVYSQEKSRSFNFIIRITLFLMTPLIAICVVLFQYLPPDLGINIAAVDVVYAILPTLAAGTFSTQKDILGVWKFWRSSAEDSDEYDTSQTLSVPTRQSIGTSSSLRTRADV